jgi:murein DD-endopeptidase MepM/ murein hydrolase activator NlpD
LAVVVLVVGLGAQSQRRPAREDGLRRELRGVQSQKRQIQTQIRAKQREARVVMGDIARVDGRLTQLEDQIEQTTSRLQAGMRAQGILAEELSLASAQLTEKRTRVRARLRAMAVNRHQTFLAALATSEDLGDFASRRAVLERVATLDRQLLEDVARLQREVADKKRRQDQLVAEVRGLRARQVGEQNDLEDARKEKAGYLDELRRQQAALRAQYDELERESNALAARIRAIQAARRSSGQDLPRYQGGFIRPVQGRFTSGFGYRTHPILGERRMHAGVDFAAPPGTPIVSVAPGIVIDAGYRRGYGNTVVIDHGGGVSTLYAHCSRLFVSEGQRVRQGQRIAAVGSTGLSTGPHLHFEVRINGVPVNPMPYL